LISNFNLIKFS